MSLFEVRHTLNTRSNGYTQVFKTNSLADFTDWFTRTVEYYKSHLKYDRDVISYDLVVSGVFDYEIRITNIAGKVEVLEGHAAFDPGFEESK